MASEGRSLRRGRALLASFGLGLLLVGWMLATPIGVGVDESSHIVAAAADAHLEVHRSPEPRAQEAYQRVVVARSFALLHDETLCAISTGGPAGCRLPPKLCRGLAGPGARCHLPAISDPRPARGLTWTGRYPPAYLFLTGLPTLLSSEASAVVAMRSVSLCLSLALLSAALLAALRWGRRPLLVLGSLAAITPTLLGTAVIVNPSGLELSAAVALWTAGSLLALGRGAPPKGLLAIVGASGVALSISRPASPLWLLVILLVLLLLAGRERRAELARERAVRWWAAALLIAGAASVAWVLAAHSTVIIHEWLPHGWSQATSWSARSWPSFVLQAVAQLGVGNVSFPGLVTWTWAGIIGAIVLLGMARLLRAERARLPGVIALAAACGAAPVVLSLSQVPEATPYGRYLLVLLAGIPILFGGLASGGLIRTARAGVLLLAALGVVALVAFLHRMTVGPGGPWWGSQGVPGEWAPPLPSAAIVLIGVVGALLLATSLWRGLGDLDSSVRAEEGRDDPLVERNGQAGRGELAEPGAQRRPPRDDRWG